MSAESKGQQQKTVVIVNKNNVKNKNVRQTVLLNAFLNRSVI